MAASSGRRLSFETFKRNSTESNKVISSEKTRKTSFENVRRPSIVTYEGDAPPEVAETQGNQGEHPGSYVQSKFCRQGSIQYRNAGWKSSRNRTDSSSSAKSNSSGKILAKSESQPKIIAPQMTSDEQKVYFQQQFLDIAAILQDAGIDEDIVQKIRDTD